MPQQLLVETVSYVQTNAAQVQESREKNGGQLILEGLLQRANARNQNNRVYPYEYLKREDNKYQSKIKEGRAWGELDHPDEAQVQLKYASHRLVETSWNGSELFGKILVLDKYSAPSGDGGTPMGQIAGALIESGGSLGISSRAVGSTKRTNENFDLVGEDLLLIAFDFVSDPSTNNAILKIKEGAEIDINLYPQLRLARLDEVINEILTFDEENFKKQFENNI